jgi:hypothetical protein
VTEFTALLGREPKLLKPETQRRQRKPTGLMNTLHNRPVRYPCLHLRNPLCAAKHTLRDPESWAKIFPKIPCEKFHDAAISRTLFPAGSVKAREVEFPTAFFSAKREVFS